MVADLMTRNRFVGSKNDEVVKLLGEVSCYVYYGDEPCYLLSLEGHRYQLEFGVNHSDRPGTVIDVSVSEY
jgi:hypothetical protein